MLTKHLLISLVKHSDQGSSENCRESIKDMLRISSEDQAKENTQT